MPITQQDFLATSIRNGAKDLLAAFLTLPEGKRDWSPGGTARTAIDLVAECALSNGYTADVVETAKWSAPPYDEYLLVRSGLASQGLGAVEKLLVENTQRLVGVVESVPDEEMCVEIETAFGVMSKAHLVAYPYWNMSYHEGQIYYIASIVSGH
ncbi:MAG: hypothetical protein H7145_24180 [Akkermansiaceae bacterium]|nr:hypothetical protein [Armatimonadota bacterium]